MTSLAIRFERDDLPDYNLLPYPTRSAEKPDYTFELLEAELIHKGETFNVYRGPLVRSDNKFTAAVVKLAWRDSHPDAGGSLVYEYSLYLSRLKKLQGKIVPLCHGLFQGETEHGFVTALLLQDLGQENKDKLFADYGPDEKMDLVDTIIRLHKAGIEHNDLNEDNIIFHKNRWFLVDFEEANKHKCGGRMAINEGAFAPPETAFGCSELWNLAMDLGVWRTGELILVSSGESLLILEEGLVRLFGSWFREDLVRFARRRGYDSSTAQPHVEEAIDKVWAYLTAIRSREDQCQPREYWYYLGEE